MFGKIYDGAIFRRATTFLPSKGLLERGFIPFQTFCSCTVSMGRVGMKTAGPRLFVLLGSGLCIAFAGCNAGHSTLSSPAPQPTGVLFVPTPPTRLAVNAASSVYAVTAYPLPAPGNNTRVSYSLSCGSPGACGSFSSSSEIGAATYTAPPTIPAGGTVTITATSLADPSLSASAVITITPPVPISVAFFSAVPASLAQSTSTALSARIQNDTSLNPQVKWSVTCPDTDCGSFSATQTGSEQLTTYTAPETVPSGGNVTITVASNTDPSKSVSTAVAILLSPAQLADGTYVFQIAGLNSVGNTFTTGTFVASGGSVVGGEQDSVQGGVDDYLPQFSQIMGGAYAPMPDGNLQISLNVPSLSGLPEILTGTMTTGGRGFVSGVQGIVGTGTLDLQTSTAAPTGSYAILLSSGTSYEQSPLLAGILNVDGSGSISGNGSVLNIETSAGPTAMQINASSISSPDSYGRVSIQLNSTADTSLCPMVPYACATYITGYIVDAAHLRLILSTYPGNTYFSFLDLGGLALAQGTSTGSFSTASVAGSSYVFAAEGRDQTGVLQLAGALNFNAGGSVTGVLNWNDLTGGTAQSPQPFTGTYTVDPTGRITLTNLTDGANFNYSMHFYLDGKGNGLVLGSDVNDQFTGQAFERQATAFSASSLSGRYGLSAGLYASPLNSSSTSTLTGRLTSTPSGNSDMLSGYADLGNGAYDFALTGTLSADSSGIFQGQFAGFNGILKIPHQPASSAPNSFTLYMIDNTQGVLIETNNTQLLLGRMQLAQ